MHRVEVDVGRVADGAEGFEARHGAILVVGAVDHRRRSARPPAPDGTVPCPWTGSTSTRCPDPVAVLCDLDGVVWLSHEAIPGSVDAVARLRAGGRRVVFVTNNSSALVATQEDALAAIGIPATGDVLTSAIAAAALVRAGGAGAGVRRAGRRRGRRAARAPSAVAGDDPAGVDVDAVLVGFHRNFDFERMRIAATAVRRGARLIATNDDATYPTPDGPIPGGGAILASVATATGCRAGRRRQAVRADGRGGARPPR